MTLRSLKHELAELYRKMKTGEVNEKDGRALVYALHTQAEFIKTADLEAAIDRIESRMSRDARDTGDASVLELPALPDDPPTSQ